MEMTTRCVASSMLELVGNSFCCDCPIHSDFVVLQGMFMDIKLNAMQHSVATLEKLCKRYLMHKDKNPLISSR
uniref:Uncharacterized protein LOC103334075 n=1 Tax=Rhizophora mucronata TaxID=61149 RepID=A0A2P2IJD2_RHIMU